MRRKEALEIIKRHKGGEVHKAFVALIESMYEDKKEGVLDAIDSEYIKEIGAARILREILDSVR